MIKGKGRVINRPTMTGKKPYDKYFVYIPTEIARDGLFPFKAGEVVAVEINKNSLVIRKIRKKH
jgi:hypothetical protein